MAYDDYTHITIPTSIGHFHSSSDWKEERKWCEENFGLKSQEIYEKMWEWDDGTWTIFYGGHFCFINTEDAMAFKLRWL